MKTTTHNELVSVINNANAIRFFLNLYYRWEDEKMYEDFADYAKAMMKYIPTGATLIKGTKRPFGVKFEYNGFTAHIYLKIKGNACGLVLAM
jgi:hypothetical protein